MLNSFEGFGLLDVDLVKIMLPLVRWSIDGCAFLLFEACIYAIHLFSKKKSYILMLQFVLIMVGSGIHVLCTSVSHDLLHILWEGWVS
jgi:hypothetical protein